jgi:hypothetical protein
MSTPMLGVTIKKRSPLKELVPTEAVAGPSHDKGKSREQAEMDKGAAEKARSLSLTVSKYVGVFHGGDSTFIYN